MVRFALAAVAASFFFHCNLLAQEPTQPPAAEQPSAEQPAAQQPATESRPTQPQPLELVEATKEEIWTLGGQRWDFKDVATTYKPVKGLMNPQSGIVQWTLEIVREMPDGEIAMHENLEGTPFKPAFLDAERIAVEFDAPTRMSKIAGKVGDRITVGVMLPPPEILERITLIRLGKRTNVGF